MILKAIIAVVLLEACYAGMLFVLLLRAMSRGSAFRRRTKNEDAARPVIRDALVEYLAGSSNLPALRDFSKTHRRLLAECLLELHTAVSGSARERLWELGLELSLVHDWCEETRSRDRLLRCLAFERLALACTFEPCRRIAGDLQLQALEDPDAEVRYAAARGLAHSEDVADIERVFRMAAGQNTLGRVLLTEALRRHAVMLCERVAPELLRSNDEKQVLSVLEIVLAWERAVPLVNLDELISKGSAAIQQKALRVLPLVPACPEHEEAVMRCLSAPNRDVVLEAIVAAGRLKLEMSLPALAHYLQHGPSQLAHASADALANLPPRGWEILAEFGARESEAVPHLGARERLRAEKRTAPV